MKISCLYCGASIDTSKYDKCPNCGAAFNDNEEYKEEQKFYDDYKRLILEEKEARIAEQKIKNKQSANNNDHKTTNKNKSIKKFAPIRYLIPILISIPIMLLGAISLFALGDVGIDQPIDTTEPYVEPYHNAIAGEIVSTMNYQVVLDKWGYYEPKSYAIRNGEKYIKFHFIYTNTSDKQIYDEEQVYCYDSNGRTCNSQASLTDYDSMEKFKRQIVMPGKFNSGWCYFCIPEHETEVTIMFGEKIEIKVQLDDNSDVFDPGQSVTQYDAEFGEIVTTEKLELIFDKWDYYEPDIKIGSGKKYIKVHVKYTNISNNDFQIGQLVYCYDSNGKEYGSILTLLKDEDNAQRIEKQNIEPGKSYMGWYYFDIPETINSLTIKPFKNVNIHIDLEE